MERLIPDASWWLKFDRAKEHLDNLNEVTKDYRSRREHAVTKSIETKKKPTQWVYRVWFDGAPDQRWALIAGDFLFNLSVALDHIAVALNPSQMADSLIYFPICVEDPFRRQPGTRRYEERDPGRRRTFTYAVKRMVPDARQVIFDAQPYSQAQTSPGNDPADHFLAILKRLHTTDKHRRMLALNSGMERAVAQWTDPTGSVHEVSYEPPPTAAAGDGAILMRQPYEVDVKVVGSVSVGFGRKAQPIYVLSGLARVAELTETLLLALETHVPT